MAAIVGTMSTDEELLAAAVLHDTVEDTPTTIEDIEDWVGPTIIAIVAGIALLYVWRILTWKPRD